MEKPLSFREERAVLAAALADIEAAIAEGHKHPHGYRAEFYRHQLSELDKLIADEEAG